ncbi:hypothetical protein DCC39_09015 [Pueribacillus theae]|uniref:YwgA family protein n=1 Tax=Pueribacillus theae TaxID=2171751 RepID=A0A2U1K329_9BACI|nr:YwgA family protein [Pueribacillus theae]PWA11916.1 hypothetical protein DCC39_09015 [Pueribacillus theae]
MLEDHVRLMMLLKNAGEVAGRKKLQKMVYIAKRLDFPFNERYDFHFYGPYSEELTLKIEELCNLGLVKEVKEKKGGYYQYCYSLTDEGETFLLHYDMNIPLLHPFVEALNGESSRFLELVSTILYFGQLDKQAIKEKVAVVKRKQAYSEDEVEKGFRYIESIKKIAH